MPKNFVPKYSAAAKEKNNIVLKFHKHSFLLRKNGWTKFGEIDTMFYPVHKASLFASFISDIYAFIRNNKVFKKNTLLCFSWKTKTRRMIRLRANYTKCTVHGPL